MNGDEACSLLGYSEQELLVMNVDELVPAKYRFGHENKRQKYIKSPSNRNMLSSPRSVFAEHKDGSQIPVEIRLNTIKTRYGDRILVSLRDFTEHNELVKTLEFALEKNKSLNQEVSIDPLTELKNRRFFEEAAIREFAQSKRHNLELSIAMIDIDYFKKVNDSFGHAVGDYALKLVSSELKKYIRAGDTLARIGGEEFAILLPSTSLPAAEILLERIRVSINELQFTNNTPETITISIGLTNLYKSDDNYQELLKRADEALYKAKDEGRNKVITRFNNESDK